MSVLASIDRMGRLTNDMLTYCPESGEFRWRIKPSGSCNAGDVAGCITRDGYRCISLKGRLYQAHRLAFLMMLGRWPNEWADHINGDRSDNRWANLRECSNAENQQNRKARRARGHIGVYFRKEYQRWYAHIRFERKRRHLGSFQTEAEAIAAYLAAKKELHKFCRKPRAAIDAMAAGEDAK